MSEYIAGMKARLTEIEAEIAEIEKGLNAKKPLLEEKVKIEKALAAFEPKKAGTGSKARLPKETKERLGELILTSLNTESPVNIPALVEKLKDAFLPNEAKTANAIANVVAGLKKDKKIMSQGRKGFLLPTAAPASDPAPADSPADSQAA